MASDIETQLAHLWPPHKWQDVTVLVGVSGGPDSVALLRAMKSLKTAGIGRLLVAHFNHHLRGHESEADEAFVVELSRQFQIPCEIGRAATLQRDCGGDGLEAGARKARYGFFRETADRVGARYLVTGHTADDQIETILHHILRGTGLTGLAGMARCRPLSKATTLIRPLLDVRRADLVAYLDELKQPYRTDSSNANVQLTRNRIRHELLPLLASQFNPAIDEALLRLGTLAGEVQSVVDDLTESLADRAVDPRDKVLSIDAAAVAGKPDYLIRHLFVRLWRRRGWPLQSMGYAEWNHLAEMLLRGEPKKKVFPGNVLAECVDDRLYLRREEKQR
ncbi:MAG: tRNA lysidine(34) synthetase TilS [Pirellulales bacterium]|nr:tRNA lysidine(34) synthetase TilS [Pirellulales bacterium]